MSEREQAALYRIESGMLLIDNDKTILASAYRKLEAELEGYKRANESAEKMHATVVQTLADCGEQLQQAEAELKTARIINNAEQEHIALLRKQLQQLQKDKMVMQNTIDILEGE